MSINFGKVEKYFDKKGFGFVTRKINSKGKPAIFFHIKTIEQSDPDLALKLKNNEIENLFFWYDSEKTNKGKQVRCVIQPTEIDISKHPELLKKSKINGLTCIIHMFQVGFEKLSHKFLVAV